MVISKTALEKIRRIFERNYKALGLILTDPAKLTPSEVQQLEKAGIKPIGKSPFDLIYYHNVLNDLNSKTAPTTIPGMEDQQARANNVAGAHVASVEHVNSAVSQLIEKLKISTQAGVEGLLRDYNLINRRKKLLGEAGSVAEAVEKETSVSALKVKLRDYFGDAARDFDRIAITETANAIGLGSVDRVVNQNKSEDLGQVYVFRIPVQDAALCRWCRRFYLDSDESPAVYLLSTLLENGTNYGKKTSDWLPVAGATHPSDRESGVIQLNPGWKVAPGGSLEWMGLDGWDEYIEGKVRG